MKKTLILSFSLSCLFILPNLAVANDSQIDISKTTCRDLLLADGEEQTNILIFHHGYLAGLSKQRVVDVDKLATETLMVKEQCIDTPAENLLKIFLDLRKASGSN